MEQCPYCAGNLPVEASVCPHCERDLPQEALEVDDVDGEDAPIPREWGSAAVYALETAARCPFCREPLRSVRVVRMNRTQVAFTSTLPRSGRAIVCPQCERILSVEIGAIF